MNKLTLELSDTSMELYLNTLLKISGLNGRRGFHGAQFDEYGCCPFSQDMSEFSRLNQPPEVIRFSFPEESLESPVCSRPRESPVCFRPRESPVCSGPRESPVFSRPRESPVCSRPRESPVCSRPREYRSNLENRQTVRESSDCSNYEKTTPKNNFFEQVRNFLTDPELLSDFLSALTGLQSYEDVLLKKVSRETGIPVSLFLSCLNSLAGSSFEERRRNWLNCNKEEAFEPTEQSESTENHKEEAFEPTESSEPTEAFEPTEQSESTENHKKEEESISKNMLFLEKLFNTQSEEGRSNLVTLVNGITSEDLHQDKTTLELLFLVESTFQDNPTIIRGGILDGKLNGICTNITYVDALPDGWNPKNATALLALYLENPVEFFSSHDLPKTSISDQELVGIAESVISNTVSNLILKAGDMKLLQQLMLSFLPKREQDITRDILDPAFRNLGYILDSSTRDSNSEGKKDSVIITSDNEE